MYGEVLMVNKKIWFPLALLLLATLGCEDAQFCNSTQNCPPSSNEGSSLASAGGGVNTGPPSSGGTATAEPSELELGYAAVLQQECSGLCATLNSCNIQIFSNAGNCFDSCLAQEDRDQYWQCEPVFREALGCYQSSVDCDFSLCHELIGQFDECSTPVPSAANSCVHANNGICDEPHACVHGSDTNDCSL